MSRAPLAVPVRATWHVIDLLARVALHVTELRQPVLAPVAPARPAAVTPAPRRARADVLVGAVLPH